ncbi:hypothetical protein [Streptacidiphilus sp. EB129]|uniref:hypothetical protein n=1 Tax=Streptacidiphilus sp. EB129 TaxID=3156262 RepID=UPI0035162473
MLPGVDYEREWLMARSAADVLNAVLAQLGFTASLMRAQAGWADDGQGTVYLEASPLGARKLLRALERMEGDPQTA